MATKGKPRWKIKAGPKNRKTTARPKSRNAPPSDPLDGFIDAALQVLALPVEPQWRAAIRANLEVNLRMGKLVAEFALPDGTEPAPIFTA
jgi:Protein of unknown function (DUF4089)